MKKLVIGLAARWTAAPARAGGVTVKPLLDLRLRWENVDQDGIAKDANAVTLRARTGAEVTLGDFRLLGEAESTMPFVERYFSGLNGKTKFPLIADPGNFELNRFQLQYRGVKDLVVTAGRQRINIEDQRFVGSAGWRQNEQTFDAARVEYGTPKGLQLDLTYAWSDRTIWGIEGTGARQTAISGDNIFARATDATPVARLSAFAYLVARDAAPGQMFLLSGKTHVP